jgi:transcriptional regulator GlxA family with amidase domain
MLGYLLERMAATRSESGVETIVAAPSPGLALVKRTLEAHPERSMGLERLARLAGCSRFHFVRAFRLAYRETPHRYQVRCRIEKAKTLLAQRSNPRLFIPRCYIYRFGLELPPPALGHD